MTEIVGKLVELMVAGRKICDDCDCVEDDHCPYDETDGCLDVLIANHMIANGVTIQRWIPVDERLPTIHDADDDNCVLAIHRISNKRYYHWRTVVDNPFDFTHWMRTPKPPKKDQNSLTDLCDS